MIGSLPGVDPLGIPAARPALHDAAASNDVDAVRDHLAAGVPIDLPDADRCTPLHAAVRSGALDAAGVLVEAGADIEARGHLELLTPLQLAALWWRQSPDGSMIALLRGYEADPAARDAHGLSAADIGSRHADLPPLLAALLE